MRGTQRLVPAVFVIAALALGASNPHRVAGPAPPPLFQPECSGYSSDAAGDSVIRFSVGAGITQPLPAGVPVAACSVQVRPAGFSYPLYRLREWDPTTLAPDPHAIAERGMFLDPSVSQLFPTLPKVMFVPPVITKSLARVAERVRETLALQVGTTSSYFFSYNGPLEAHFTPQGPASLPAASGYTADGWTVPLEGAHPVIAHALCAGTEDLAALRVAQSVKRADALLPGTPFEVLQGFRVPERVELRWSEVATRVTFFMGAPTAPAMPVVPPYVAVLAIHDGMDDMFGSTMPEPLVRGFFDPDQPWSSFSTYWTTRRLQDSWLSHTDFDATVVLEPAHDYWIHLRGVSGYGFWTRRLDGTESADFKDGVGELYTRADTTSEWVSSDGFALDFKIIGRPLEAPAPPPVSGGGVQLAIAPNPATDAAHIRWAGAVGSVTLEVYDARGRRVAKTEGGAAGEWTWQGSHQQRLRSGMYFVKLRDSAGGTTERRLIVVR